MRVGGLGGPSKAGPRIAILCKYFIVEDLREMWQKKILLYSNCLKIL